MDKQTSVVKAADKFRKKFPEFRPLYERTECFDLHVFMRICRIRYFSYNAVREKERCAVNTGGKCEVMFLFLTLIQLRSPSKRNGLPCQDVCTSKLLNSLFTHKRCLERKKLAIYIRYHHESELALA